MSRTRKYGETGTSWKEIEVYEGEKRVIARMVEMRDGGMSYAQIARVLTDERIPTQRGTTADENPMDFWSEPLEAWERGVVKKIVDRAITERQAQAGRVKFDKMTDAEKVAYQAMYEKPLMHDEVQEAKDEEQRLLRLADDPTHPDHEWVDPIRLENAVRRERERKTAVALQVLGAALGLDVIPTSFVEPLSWDSEDRKLGREGEARFGGGQGDADTRTVDAKIIEWLYRTEKRNVYETLDKAIESGEAQDVREIKYLVRRLIGEVAIQRQANLSLVQRLTRQAMKEREDDQGSRGFSVYDDPRSYPDGRPKYQHGDR